MSPISSKLYLICIMLFVSIIPVYAEQSLFDGTLKDSDTFKIENIDYQLVIGSNSISLNNMFKNIGINENRCKTDGNYNFCTGAIIRGGERELPRVQLKITRMECNNGTQVCKLDFGKLCSSNEQCASGTCFRGACTSKSPVCGDGYCDVNENPYCSQCDCERIAEVNSEDNTQVSIPSNKDWIDTKFTLKKGVIYTFEVTGTYSLDYSGERISSVGKDKYSSNSPFPSFKEGATIARVCGKVYPLDSSLRLIPDSNCELYARINENVLFDNSGNISIKINEGSALVDLQKEVLNKVNTYINDINYNHYNEIAAMSSGKVKELFDMFWDIQSRTRAVVGNDFRLYQDKIELRTSKITNKGTEWLVTAETTLNGVNGTLIFHFSYSDSNLKLTDVEYPSYKLSEVNRISTQNELDRKVNEITGAFVKQQEEKSKDEKGHPFITFLVIAGIIYMILRAIFKKDGNSPAPTIRTDNGRLTSEELEELESKNDTGETKKIRKEWNNHLGKTGYYQEEKENQKIRQQTYRKKEETKEKQKRQKELESKEQVEKQKQAEENKIKAAKGRYEDFLKQFEPNVAHCESWADYVRAYINIFKKDTSKFGELTTYIQHKYEHDDYNTVSNTLKGLYETELKKRKPEIISELKEIDMMSGSDFEEYLRLLFQNLGYGVKKTQQTRDGGVDLILNKESEITLVQAKRYKINGVVGVDAVRDVYSNKETYGAKRMVVLTTAMNFSLDAIKKARELNVELKDRNEFKDLLRKSKMINEEYTHFPSEIAHSSNSALIGKIPKNIAKVPSKNSSNIILDENASVGLICPKCGSNNTSIASQDQLDSARRNASIRYSCEDCSHRWRD